MGLEHFLDLLGINFLSRRVDADASAAEQGQAAIGFYPTPVARNGIAHPIDRAKRLRGFLGVLVIAYGDRTLPGDKSRHAAPQIGRAHVCTPVTNAQLVCRLLLENKKQIQYYSTLAHNNTTMNS